MGLKQHGTRLLLQRSDPAGMAVTQRGDCVPAVIIQYPPAIATMEPDALGGDHLQRVLGEYLGEVALSNRSRHHIVLSRSQLQPTAGAVNPKV